MEVIKCCLNCDAKMDGEIQINENAFHQEQFIY